MKIALRGRLPNDLFLLVEEYIAKIGIPLEVFNQPDVSGAVLHTPL